MVKRSERSLFPVSIIHGHMKEKVRLGLESDPFEVDVWLAFESSMSPWFATKPNQPLHSRDNS